MHCSVEQYTAAAQQDQLSQHFGAQVATTRARSLAYVLLTWGIIVAHFLASDYLYLQDFPHWQIYAILGALWLAIYKAFDNTRQVRSAPACLIKAST